jgi:adenylate cyclase, class 2
MAAARFKEVCDTSDCKSPAETTSRKVSILTLFEVHFYYALRAGRSPHGFQWLILAPMQSIETEIKFRVADEHALESKLALAGFHMHTAKTFERNVLYDYPDRKLRSSGEILRIREYGPKWVITHKAFPPDNSPEAKYKQRIETETTVDDGEAIANILRHLGLVEAFTYEKWRTEWADQTGHCVLDVTPIGVFAELEGPAEWIDATAKKLGVGDSEYMTLSYGRLFDLWKLQTGSTVNDLTFDGISGSSPSN